MTDAATKFVSPLTFQTLSGNPVHTDLFAAPPLWNVEHVALAERADLGVVAPATANIIGKVASGVADDFLSTTLLAMSCPVLFVPSMNANMYAHPAVKRNLGILSDYGYEVMTPDTGRLASGLVGPGRYPETDRILAACLRLLGPGDFTGMKVVVSAGPTREFFDPVRFVSNPSTGRMGFALAAEARRRGAEVVLVAGPTDLKPPEEVTTIRVTTVGEMRDRILSEAESARVVVMAAAPADWLPATRAAQKMKKAEFPSLSLELAPAPDILAELGQRRRGPAAAGEARAHGGRPALQGAGGPVLVGFAAETQELLANAKAKLKAKNVDLMVANQVAMVADQMAAETDSGFGTETNRVTLLARDGSIEELPLLSKSEVARAVFDRIARLVGGGGEGHAGAGRP
jgi:phosphopantothenoylcysteine decarboxylase/phosphopantothenate--cysteine ligase